MGRKEKKSVFARFREWLIAVPHLFAKLTVIWCVGFGSGASYYALRILSHTGNDPAALLGVILAFFGGELLILCLRTILKKEKVSKSDTEGERYEEFLEEDQQP